MTAFNALEAQSYALDREFQRLVGKHQSRRHKEWRYVLYGRTAALCQALFSVSFMLPVR